MKNRDDNNQDNGSDLENSFNDSFSGSDFDDEVQPLNQGFRKEYSSKTEPDNHLEEIDIDNSVERKAIKPIKRLEPSTVSLIFKRILQRQKYKQSTASKITGGVENSIFLRNSEEENQNIFVTMPCTDASQSNLEQSGGLRVEEALDKIKDTVDIDKQQPTKILIPFARSRFFTKHWTYYEINIDPKTKSATVNNVDSKGWLSKWFYPTGKTDKEITKSLKQKFGVPNVKHKSTNLGTQGIMDNINCGRHIIYNIASTIVGRDVGNISTKEAHGRFNDINKAYANEENEEKNNGIDLVGNIRNGLMNKEPIKQTTNKGDTEKTPSIQSQKTPTIQQSNTKAKTKQIRCM